MASQENKKRKGEERGREEGEDSIWFPNKEIKRRKKDKKDEKKGIVKTFLSSYLNIEEEEGKEEKRNMSMIKDINLLLSISMNSLPSLILHYQVPDKLSFKYIDWLDNQANQHWERRKVYLSSALERAEEGLSCYSLIEKALNHQLHSQKLCCIIKICKESIQRK